jgi:hypothetical protein
MVLLLQHHAFDTAVAGSDPAVWDRETIALMMMRTSAQCKFGELVMTVVVVAVG